MPREPLTSQTFDNAVSLVIQVLHGHALDFLILHSDGQAATRTLTHGDNLEGLEAARQAIAILQELETPAHLRKTTSTEELFQKLTKLATRKYVPGGSAQSDSEPGLRAAEMQLAGLQGQLLQGLRRRGARRQLNRMDRVARAARRRELLADASGPIQSLLLRRISDLQLETD